MIKDIIYGYKLNEELYALLCIEKYNTESIPTIFYYIGVNIPDIKVIYSRLNEDENGNGYKRTNNLIEDKKVKVIDTVYDWNDFFSYEIYDKTFNSIGYEYHEFRRETLIPITYRNNIKYKEAMNALIEDYENLFLLLKLNGFK